MKFIHLSLLALTFLGLSTTGYSQYYNEPAKNRYTLITEQLDFTEAADFTQDVVGLINRLKVPSGWAYAYGQTTPENKKPEFIKINAAMNAASKLSVKAYLSQKDFGCATLEVPLNAIIDEGVLVKSKFEVCMKAKEILEMVFADYTNISFQASCEVILTEEINALDTELMEIRVRLINEHAKLHGNSQPSSGSSQDIYSNDPTYKELLKKRDAAATKIEKDLRDGKTDQYLFTLRTKFTLIPEVEVCIPGVDGNPTSSAEIDKKVQEALAAVRASATQIQDQTKNKTVVPADLVSEQKPEVAKSEVKAEKLN